jgi:hypothetical protein
LERLVVILRDTGPDPEGALVVRAWQESARRGREGIALLMPAGPERLK